MHSNDSRKRNQQERFKWRIQPMISFNRFHCPRAAAFIHFCNISKNNGAARGNQRPVFPTPWKNTRDYCYLNDGELGADALVNSIIKIPYRHYGRLMTISSKFFRLISSWLKYIYIYIYIYTRSAFYYSEWITFSRKCERGNLTEKTLATLWQDIYTEEHNCVNDSEKLSIIWTNITL